jgi:hypothetical protein
MRRGGEEMFEGIGSLYRGLEVRQGGTRFCWVVPVVNLRLLMSNHRRVTFLLCSKPVIAVMLWTNWMRARGMSPSTPPPQPLTAGAHRALAADSSAASHRPRSRWIPVMEGSLPICSNASRASSPVRRAGPRVPAQGNRAVRSRRTKTTSQAAPPPACRKDHVRMGVAPVG